MGSLEVEDLPAQSPLNAWHNRAEIGPEFKTRTNPLRFVQLFWCGMAYNLDTFKVKKLENLQVPVASLLKHERQDWHPKQTVDGDKTTFEVMEGSHMTGVVRDGVLHVEEFACRSEGSGVAMNWIFEPALKDSKGEFIASCVWEGGDTVNQLRVKDGAVEWVDIEI